MTEKQKKFLELINQVMPNLTELEQEKLLSFGEGLAFMCRPAAGQPPAEQESA